MRIKNPNSSGFTLLEVLLAAIIFVVSVAGIFATLSAVRAPIANKENGLVAAVFGKKILETLRTNVSSGAGLYYGICGAGCTCTGTSPAASLNLCLGAHSYTLPVSGFSWPTTDLSNNNATLNYTVSCADGSAAAACGADIARKVDLNINW